MTVISQILQRGLTTAQGTSAEIPFLLGLGIVADMPEGNLKMASLWMVLLGLVIIKWLTKGHEAAEPAELDVPADEGDIDLQEDLQDVLIRSRQFVGVPLALVSEKLPVGISQKGIDLIKEFEGFRPKSYKCPAGVWTIGYGHTVGVKPGMTVTREQAEAMLRKDLKIYEKHVADALGDTTTSQGQLDALVSFCFNAGPGNLRKSSMLRLHKQGKYRAAAEAFMAWTKGGGRVLPGLVRRRKAEKALYLS